MSGGSGTGTPVSAFPGIDTSDSTSFNVTRNDVIYMAFEDMGIYAPGFETPTAGQIDTANKRLNTMIKGWQAAGVGLWLNQLSQLTLTAATQSYTMGPTGVLAIPKPLDVVEARRVDSNNNELPMTKMSRDEYMKLPLKSSSGPVTQYYYDRQLVNGLFYVWPVESDLTCVVKFTYRCPIQDFVSPDDTPDFPQEWFDALHFNLAYRLCPAFKVRGEQFGMIKEQAALTLQSADGFDREQTSIQFVPNFDR